MKEMFDKIGWKIQLFTAMLKYDFRIVRAKVIVFVRRLQVKRYERLLGKIRGEQ